MTLHQPLQKKAFDAIEAALPFGLDGSKITVDPGVSYTRSPIKAHDYAAGLMAAFGSVVERIGRQRGLPSQTLRLNRRRCGLLLNAGQMQFLNGYGCLMDTWPIGPDNGIYRAKDGRHVTIIGLHPHLRDGLLTYFQCPNSASAIQTAFERRTSQEIEDDLAALRLPAGIVRTPGEWLAHPQGEATAKRPMIDLDQVAPVGGSRKLSQAKRRPLEGVRVVEMALLVAGPTMGRLLAEQGADVIKVQPPLGDWTVPLWLDTNWGKRSILTDAKSRSGNARLRELLKSADVLINSYSPGSMQAMGLDDATLRALNPDLILASVSYAAPGTPWEDRKGFEQIAQSVSGMIHANSTGLAAPTVISVLLNDYLTGYLGAIGAVAALSEREERGGTWRVGASLTRCATMAAAMTEPVDGEPYAPVTMEDMMEHGIDQPTPIGAFTRLKSAVDFSHTPSMAVFPTGFPGSDSDTIGWLDPAYDGDVEPPHYPSRLAREGRIRNLVSCHGIEDRGDGGGGVSLASRQLMEYVVAGRRA